MKKILVLSVSLILLFSLAACKEQPTDPTAGSPASSSTSGTTTTTSASQEETGVRVSTENFPAHTVITTERVADRSAVEAALTQAKTIELYDLTARLDGETVQPSGEVEVTFPLPQEYDAARHAIEVYYVADDGRTEKIESSVEDGQVLARLPHFSLYAVIVVDKPSFRFAVAGDIVADEEGRKVYVSDINLTFTYDEGDTWETFVQKNDDTGFSIDKDFFGEKDIVYYTYDGVRYQVYRGIGPREIAAADVIEYEDYACGRPFRETMQGCWMYETSMDGYIDPVTSERWDRATKEILLGDDMTYTIRFIKIKDLTADSYEIREETLETGTYTSTDGDTLGAVLTFSNGYILRTDRSNSFSAQLTIDGETVTARADLPDEFF